MSDNPIQFLSKKNSRRKKLSGVHNNIMRIRQVIKTELWSNTATFNAQKSARLTEYEKRYKVFIQDEFTLNSVLLIQHLVTESTTIPQNLKKYHQIIKKMILIAKQLMLTEFEIAFYSLYLDKLEWQTDRFNDEDNLLLTGLAVKVDLNDDSDFLFNFLEKSIPNIKSMFQMWLHLKTNHYSKLKITPLDINERLKLLSMPDNSIINQQNFLDHDHIVDQILHMILPKSSDTQKSDDHSNESNIVTNRKEVYQKENLYYTVQRNNNNCITNFNINESQSNPMKCGNDTGEVLPEPSQLVNNKNIFPNHSPMSFSQSKRYSLSFNMPCMENSESMLWNKSGGLYFENNSPRLGIFRSEKEEDGLSMLSKTNSMFKNQEWSVYMNI